MTALPLNSTQEAILETFKRYFFMTIDQVQALHFGEGSYTHTSENLKRLCEYEYLALLKKESVNAKHIYTLGKRGVRFLRERSGDFAFTPSEHRYHDRFIMRHWHSTTDFLIASERYARISPDIKLLAIKHDLTLQSELKKKVRAQAIPDGIIQFLIRQIEIMGLWIELDRGTENWKKEFQAKIRSIIEFAHTRYVEIFETTSLTILFATTLSDYRSTQMLKWIEEELQNSPEAEWFRVACIPQGKLDPVWLFTEPIWQTPHKSGLTSLI